MMTRPLARSSEQQPKPAQQASPSRQVRAAQPQLRPARSRTGKRSLGQSVALFVWAAMMLLWLIAWVLGIWWVAPVVARLELNLDLIGGVFWLVTGAVTWMVAFQMGYRRYWAV